MRPFALSFVSSFVAASLNGTAEASYPLSTIHTEESSIFGIANVPAIYFILIFLGALSFSIWFYGVITLRISDMMPESFVEEVRKNLLKKRYEKALKHCHNENTITARIIGKAIEARTQGPQFMIQAIQSEGYSSKKFLLQRIQFLKKISFVAPIIGSAGTLIYLYLSATDLLNPSASSQSLLATLGICFGPLLVGIMVSLASTLIYSAIKHRITYLFNTIISETLTLVRTVDIDYC